MGLTLYAERVKTVWNRVPVRNVPLIDDASVKS